MARQLGKAAVLGAEEWISVLKLSTMWQFDFYRNRAIKELTRHLDNDPARRLVLAFGYNVGNWLIPALQSLAQREEPMRMEEVKLLGMERVLKICEVREHYHGNSSCQICRPGQCTALSVFFVEYSCLSSEGEANEESLNKGKASLGRKAYDFKNAIFCVFQDDLHLFPSLR